MIITPFAATVFLHALLHGDNRAGAEAAARKMAATGRPVVVVSACLVGVRCRYDGKDQLLPSLDALAADCALLPLCPEVLGGLGVPRPPASFEGDGGGAAALTGTARLRASDGRDLTDAFVRGARRADELARLAGAGAAWLKERSPSCGCKVVHQGDRLVSGRGVFAELLAARGIRLQSDEELGL
jgi:uncharacterized protein YbbK (DUF523 family)